MYPMISTIIGRVTMFTHIYLCKGKGILSVGCCCSARRLAS